jgi:class 3 adenylate cyclase
MDEREAGGTEGAPRTFLFTDLEGSTRLWETAPAAMRDALADHDALARSVVAAHRGTLVKMSGDGMLAVFASPADAVQAVLAFQRGLCGIGARHGIAITAVLASQFAAIAAIAARFLFGERIGRVATIGVVVIAVGVATVSALRV